MLWPTVRTASRRRPTWSTRPRSPTRPRRAPCSCRRSASLKNRSPVFVRCCSSRAILIDWPVFYGHCRFVNRFRKTNQCSRRRHWWHLAGNDNKTDCHRYTYIVCLIIITSIAYRSQAEYCHFVACLLAISYMCAAFIINGYFWVQVVTTWQYKHLKAVETWKLAAD